MAEKIIAAAIKYGDLVFHMPAPHRHHDIFRELERCKIGRMTAPTQGFMTSAGRFVDRYIGRTIAAAANQLIASDKDAKGVPFVRISPQLYSEDVW